MLVELSPEKYNITNGLKELESFPLIASVIHRNQKGKIFVDNFNDPKIFFIIHKSSFSYLYIKNDELDYDKFFNFLYHNDNIPQYFHIYDANEQLINEAQIRNDINIKVRKRMRMKRIKPYNKLFDLKALRDKAKNIDEIDINDLSVFNLGFTTKYWNSIEDFVNNGYGWVIYDQNKPAAIFYTVCVVNMNAESDVFTLPEYLESGFAVIAGILLLETLEQNSINMDWDVFIDNIPSISLAKGFGYKPYFNYNFLSVFKNK